MKSSVKILAMSVLACAVFRDGGYGGGAVGGNGCRYRRAQSARSSSLA